MSYKIDVSKNIIELAEKVANVLQSGTKDAKSFFTVALSGGSTPEKIFEYLAENYKEKINWNKIKFFWGDERCVPADHPDSNYLMTKESLFDKIEISPLNIFAVDGTNKPDEEAVSYSRTIKQNVESENGLPQFDLVFLGLGEDGHTASIFPDQMKLLTSDNICEAAQHPSICQKRITLSGKVINNAAQIVFLVTGKNKAGIVKTIINKENGFEKFPASYINTTNGNLTWMLDEAAATLISN